MKAITMGGGRKFEKLDVALRPETGRGWNGLQCMHDWAKKGLTLPEVGALTRPFSMEFAYIAGSAEAGMMYGRGSMCRSSLSNRRQKTI